MFRMGVVGCGKIAERHLAAYTKIPEVQVVVSDTDAPHAERTAAHFGVECAPSLEALLDADIDAVDVCVPTPYHPGCITEALLAGKHVFCEKPLAETLAEVEEIRRVRDATDRIVMVGYLYRFHPAFEMTKRALASAALGQPHLAALRLGGRGAHRAWKHQRDSGGGAINEVLVHMLDLALWFFGDVESARVLRADTLLRERYIPDGDRIIEATAEDFVLIEMQMANGCTVVCQGDLVTPGYMNHVEVQGSNGSVLASIIEELPTRLFLKEGRDGYDAGLTIRRFDQVDLFERELGYFIDCAGSGDHPIGNSVDESCRLIRLIEDIRQQIGATIGNEPLITNG